ncbi:sulfite exporter TauE/SafE family protein [Mangrovicoccus algicola]|uniref:Probable membrane transporter protein n=1 Tax=Mangrovicoccus algicola TaxID=2771008 RepID=A0A8J6YZV5_9RHOB|nr:sulfite exporter TauE/SafE family protein [Mangrovicoccus algicola]MBE3638933.1 sulfite exporter TauE/SafE family protein [Mangrovicoccus algicola]
MDFTTFWPAGPGAAAAAVAITVLAAFVKGATGFAMPMVMISGLATFLPGELALALLIVPTLVTNVIQAFGGGLGRARAAALRYWRYIAIVLVFIALSAQLVSVLPQSWLFLALGTAITGFALWQLSGRQVTVPAHLRIRVELAVGTVAGVIGGLSGVWGPPTVAYLSASGAAKEESVRVQGVVYFAGACVLTLAHLRSGVLNAQTLPLSTAMVVPAMAGLVIGMQARGRMDEVLFRRCTLAVLAVAGVNLVRRGLAGL